MSEKGQAFKEWYDCMPNDAGSRRYVSRLIVKILNERPLAALPVEDCENQENTTPSWHYTHSTPEAATYSRHQLLYLHKLRSLSTKGKGKVGSHSKCFQHSYCIRSFDRYLLIVDLYVLFWPLIIIVVAQILRPGRRQPLPRLCCTRSLWVLAN